MSRRLACWSALTAFIVPASSASQVLSPESRRIIDSVAVAELRMWRAPGMVLAVVSKDSVAYLTAYGTANAESGEPMDSGMLVSVASVSKLVTATTAAILGSTGKLDLGAPIRTQLPWLPERLGALTMTQLLSHTAGLGDRTPNVAPSPNGSLEPVCRAMSEGHLIARAGETWSYSNTAYTLAGCVIEVAAQAPFPQAVTQLLFRPLGMTRSTFNPRVAMTYPHAQGHDTRDGTPTVVRPFYSLPSIAPAGEVITTVGDLARLLRALLADGVLDGSRVLPPSLLATLTASQGRASPFLGPQREYGMGLFLRSSRDIRIAEHEGVYPGFGASVALAADKQVAAIAVLNGRYSAPVRTTHAALEVAMGLAPSSSAPDTVDIAARDSAGAEGRYVSGSDTLTLAPVRGVLSLRVGTRAFPVRARREGYWEISNFPALLPMPAAPLELTNIDASGHPAFVRLGWRAYRRLP